MVKDAPVSEGVADSLYRSKGWMTFVAIVSIIYGAVATLVGVVSIPRGNIGLISAIATGWLPVWAGAVLYSAVTHIRAAYDTHNKEELRTSLGKLGTYFRIMGIVAIVPLIAVVVGVLVVCGIQLLT